MASAYVCRNRRVRGGQESREGLGKALASVEGRSASLHASGRCLCSQSLCSTQHVLPLPKSPPVPIPGPLALDSPKGKPHPWPRWLQLCPGPCFPYPLLRPHPVRSGPLAPSQPRQHLPSPHSLPSPQAPLLSMAPAPGGWGPPASLHKAPSHTQTTATPPVLGRGPQGCVGSLCSYRSPLRQGPCASWRTQRQRAASAPETRPSSAGASSDAPLPTLRGKRDDMSFQHRTPSPRPGDLLLPQHPQQAPCPLPRAVPASGKDWRCHVCLSHPWGSAAKRQRLLLACPALPCPALPCPALPGPAWPGLA